MTRRSAAVEVDEATKQGRGWWSPRGSGTTTSLAMLALATAAAFVVGAASSLLLAGDLERAVAENREASRVYAMTFRLFALVQAILAVYFLHLGLRAWLGSETYLQALVGGSGFYYPLIPTTWVIAGFALNFVALALSGMTFVFLARYSQEFRGPTGPPAIDTLGFLTRRRNPTEIPAPAGGGEAPMVGQTLCPSCRTPNPTGRSRCRVCGLRMEEIPPEVPRPSAPPAPVDWDALRGAVRPSGRGRRKRS